MKKRKKSKNDKQIIESTKNLGSDLFKVINNYFPDLTKLLNNCFDGRNQNYITYTEEYVYYQIIMLFMLRIESLRTSKTNLISEEYIQNLNEFLKVDLETIIHDNTIKYFFNYDGFETSELSKIPTKLLKKLFRKKLFDSAKFLNEYHLLVLDGTGTMSFKKNHCEFCLRKQIKNNKGKFLYYLYYHYLVEAKIVTRFGNAISIDTEFIDNSHYNIDTNKQDCEHTGAKRLLKRINNNFKNKKFCVLLDGLYADSKIIEIIESFGWKYIIALKDKDLKSVNEEFTGLLKLDEANDNKIQCENQKITFINDIEFKGYILNVIKSIEPHTSYNAKTDDYTMKFITNIYIEKSNAEKIINHGGRCRGIIENEGFNEQKNHYNFEHLYTTNYEAHKAYYYLLQIAHAIMQFLIAYTHKNKKEIFKLYRAIKVFIKKIRDSLLKYLVHNIHAKIKIVLCDTS